MRHTPEARTALPGLALAVGLVAAAAVWSGCGREPTVTITLTAAELQEELGRKLPLKRATRLATVTVTAAQVVLVEGSDRIGLRATAELALPMGRTLTGNPQLDGRIRYVPEQGEFWFDEARLVDLGIPSVPVVIRPSVEEAVGALARSYLARTPVYRLKPGQVKHSVAKLVLRSVQVRNGKVELTLGPPTGT
jgi:hypothetical protein